MSFGMRPLSRPIACNEVLRYMVQWLYYLVACGVPVPVDYISNVFACSNMFNGFIYGTFRCGKSLLDFSDFDRI